MAPMVLFNGGWRHEARHAERQWTRRGSGKAGLTLAFVAFLLLPEAAFGLLELEPVEFRYRRRLYRLVLPRRGHRPDDSGSYGTVVSGLAGPHGISCRPSAFLARLYKVIVEVLPSMGASCEERDDRRHRNTDDGDGALGNGAQNPADPVVYENSESVPEGAMQLTQSLGKPLTRDIHLVESL